MLSSFRVIASKSLKSSSTTALRFASTSSTTQSQIEPKQKANALLSALPGSTLVSKTGWVTLTTAISAAAISNELFVLNEEVVVLGSFVVFAAYLSTLIRDPYTQWADGQIKKVTDILNVSRSSHTDAVKSRIESVAELKDVEQLTKSLFELSKQTATIEHETFHLRQKAQLTSDVKAVLDSWVRYEAQVREAEQRDLVATILANVQKSLADKKLQREILLASVVEIEQLVKSKVI